MRMREPLTASFCAVLIAALALPAAAAPLQIITLKTRVESQNGTTNGDFDVGDAIPARIGENLKVSLLGTGIVDGVGQEVPVQARFYVAAGGNNLGLVRSGPNWALISINAAGGNGLGQLAYTTTGNYQVRPSLASGRITFKIAGGDAAPPQSPQSREAPPGYQSDRWHRALEINAMLYRAILGEEPRGERARANAKRIYREGYGGVLSVAASLARAAEDRGLGRSRFERGYQERDIERVGGLYRDLLHRQQSDQELWQQDPGFRNTAEALHQKGLVPVVEGIVDSEEFRTTNQIGPR